jgi:hypothetical protein
LASSSSALRRVSSPILAGCGSPLDVTGISTAVSDANPPARKRSSTVAARSWSSLTTGWAGGVSDQVAPPAAASSASLSSMSSSCSTVSALPTRRMMTEYGSGNIGIGASVSRLAISAPSALTAGKRGTLLANAMARPTSCDSSVSKPSPALGAAFAPAVTAASAGFVAVALPVPAAGGLPGALCLHPVTVATTQLMNTTPRVAVMLHAWRSASWTPASL